MTDTLATLRQHRKTILSRREINRTLLTATPGIRNELLELIARQAGRH